MTLAKILLRNLLRKGLWYEVKAQALLLAYHGFLLGLTLSTALG